MRKSNWKVSINGQGTPVNEIITRFWASRGVNDSEQFLNPVGNILPSELLSNIHKAATIFYIMINQKSKFLIYADVDADGCSSAAILYHYLTAHGCEAEVYINKKKEHGVKDEFFNEDRGEDCVIVVDSINDTMEQYEKIWAQGKQLIILDHHIPSKVILENATSLNLVSSAINYDNPHLSGSGVTWKFVRYVDKLMNTNYAEDLVDLAAVGIIADVCNVGLESMENREICNLGFRNVVNCGLKTAIGTDEMNSDSISYTVAPLVNAANRMNNNQLALSLFLCDSTVKAKNILKELIKLKDEQKEIVTREFPKFEVEAEKQKDQSCLYFMVDESVGTLGGLLATKSADKWNRPCIVIHDTPLGYAGSMRATGVQDFREVVNSSGLAECMGHENSAGILIPRENFDKFKDYIESALRDISFTEDKVVDIYLERMQITPFLLGKLKEINRITGPGFQTVTVLIENIKNYTVKKLSQGKHLCVETPDMKFLSWNFTRWEDVVDNGSLSAVGTLSESFFAGKHTNEMIVSDYIFEVTPQKTTLW